MFEHLEKFLGSKFSNSKTEKEKNNNTQAKHGEKDQEESSLLLESNRLKFQLYKEYEENKVTILSGERYALMYLSFSFFTIIAMMFISYFRPMPDELYSEMGKIKYINMFDLQKVNHFIFHILNSISAILGIGLVCLIYSNLTLKCKNERKFQSLLIAFYGIVSHGFGLLYGASYYLDFIEDIDTALLSELKISFNQLIFFIQLFFTIIFGIFILLVINSLLSKPSHCIDMEEESLNSKESKWLIYRLIILIYIICFGISYVFISLHSNHIILKNIDTLYLKNNYSYLLCLLPYTLYSLNIAFYSSFYSFLRDSKICFSGQISVAPDKLNKNIL